MTAATSAPRGARCAARLVTDPVVRWSIVLRSSSMCDVTPVGQSVAVAGARARHTARTIWESNDAGAPSAVQRPVSERLSGDG
jgi:hypothetical protein